MFQLHLEDQQVLEMTLKELLEHQVLLMLMNQKYLLLFEFFVLDTLDLIKLFVFPLLIKIADRFEHLSQCFLMKKQHLNQVVGLFEQVLLDFLNLVEPYFEHLVILVLLNLL